MELIDHQTFGSYPPNELNLYKSGYCEVVEFVNTNTKNMTAVVETELSGHRGIILNFSGEDPETLLVYPLNGWGSPREISVPDNTTHQETLCPELIG